jgi:hypothetical protein
VDQEQRTTHDRKLKLIKFIGDLVPKRGKGLTDKQVVWALRFVSALVFIRELLPDKRPTRKQVLWVVRIVTLLAFTLGGLTLFGLPFGITLWEWVKLLIVPAVIAAVGLWFNSQQRTRELQIADERAQDEALQAYLDHMGQLLTDTERPLRRAQRGDNLSAVSRARTVAVLQRLESLRKATVLQFLYEAGLITRHRVVLDLRKADLSTVFLDRTDLTEVNLDGAEMQRALLFAVNLTGASMIETNLSSADLRGVQLQGAFLGAAYLTRCASFSDE